MSKVSLGSLVLCAAVVACSDMDSNRTVTAPDTRPALSEAPADLGVTYTLDGASDVTFASEQYSFVALRTDPATPDAAKGQFEVMYTTPAGGEIKIHGDVVCMIVFGNTSRVVGQITKVWRNGVPSPITANTHAFWVVVDNGEGQGTTDTASPMFFNNAANAQFHCTLGFPPPQFPNQDGEIQVRP